MIENNETLFKDIIKANDGQNKHPKKLISYRKRQKSMYLIKFSLVNVFFYYKAYRTSPHKKLDELL